MAGVGRAASAGSRLLARCGRRPLCAESGRRGGGRTARLDRSRRRHPCLRQSGGHGRRRSCGAGDRLGRRGSAGPARNRSLPPRRLLGLPPAGPSCHQWRNEWEEPMISMLLAAAISTLPQTSAAPSGYALTWSDEFAGDGLPDASRWRYDTQANKTGWYNEELQYYSAARPENARIEEIG